MKVGMNECRNKYQICQIFTKTFVNKKKRFIVFVGIQKIQILQFNILEMQSNLYVFVSSSLVDGQISTD
jgi:hypothetical protein